MPSVTSPLAINPTLAKSSGIKSTSTLPTVIDIRSKHVEINLKEEVVSMFNPEDGPRKLPTLLLYNEKGLQLFEEVCHTQKISFLTTAYTSSDYLPGRVLSDQR